MIKACHGCVQCAVALQSLGRLLEGVHFELQLEGQTEGQEGQFRPRGGRCEGQLGWKAHSVVDKGQRSLQSTWGGLESGGAG